jgi:hypothetical protein
MDLNVAHTNLDGPKLNSRGLAPPSYDNRREPKVGIRISKAQRIGDSDFLGAGVITENWAWASKR